MTPGKLPTASLCPTKQQAGCPRPLPSSGGPSSWVTRPRHCAVCHSLHLQYVGVNLQLLGIFRLPGISHALPRFARRLLLTAPAPPASVPLSALCAGGPRGKDGLHSQADASPSPSLCGAAGGSSRRAPHRTIKKRPKESPAPAAYSFSPACPPCEGPPGPAARGSAAAAQGTEEAVRRCGLLGADSLPRRSCRRCQRFPASSLSWLAASFQRKKKKKLLGSLGGGKISSSCLWRLRNRPEKEEEDPATRTEGAWRRGWVPPRSAPLPLAVDGRGSVFLRQRGRRGRASLPPAPGGGESRPAPCGGLGVAGARELGRPLVAGCCL